MINYNNLLKLNPFGLKKQKKNSLFFLAQKKLSIFHHKNSNEYKKITDFKFSQFKKTKKLEMLPFLHSKIFKTHNLKSTNNNLKVFVLEVKCPELRKFREKVNLNEPNPWQSHISVGIEILSKL